MRASSTLPQPNTVAPLSKRLSQRVTVRGGVLDSVVSSMRNALQRLPRGTVVVHSTFDLDECFTDWAWKVGALFATASCVNTPWWDADHRDTRVVARFVWPQTDERFVVRVMETSEPDVLVRRMAILLSDEPTEFVPSAFPSNVWPSPALVLEAVRKANPFPLHWLAALHTAGILSSRTEAR